MTSTTGKTITCRGAVVTEFRMPITIETLEVAPPQPKEVRLKMVAAGLCHSDYVWYQGKMSDQPLPFVLGHEGAGIVESVGEGVKSLKAGDHVLSIFMAQCHTCKVCLGNKSNVCEESWGKPPGNSLSRHYGYDGNPRFSLNGKPVYHLAGASSLCEYVVVPENSCVKVNPNAPLEKICLLACGFSTGYASATNAIHLLPSDKVAIWGMGGVGLAAVVGCKDKGVHQIIGLDINNDKEQIGRKLGLTDFINVTEISKPLQELIKEKTEGGVDYAIVCVGNSKVMETAIMSTCVGGTMLLVGAGDHTPMQVSPMFMFFSRKIKATIMGDYSISEDLPKLVERFMDGKLPLDDFITHRLKLDQINEGFDLMEKGKTIRSVFIM